MITDYDIYTAFILFLSCILGAILGYVMNRSHKTLERVPFFFLYTVNCFVFYVLEYKADLLLQIINVQQPLFTAIIVAIPLFFWVFVSMYLAVFRARDAFGQKSAAFLILIPVLSLMLMTFRVENNYQGEIIRDAIPTPQFMNGWIGFILTIIIMFLPIKILLYLNVF